MTIRSKTAQFSIRLSQCI